ncbi:hypothetical protein ACVIRM_001630 [Rhizobium laguerreae]
MPAPAQSDLGAGIPFETGKGLTLDRPGFGRCLHAGN